MTALGRGRARWSPTGFLSLLQNRFYFTFPGGDPPMGEILESYGSASCKSAHP